MNKILEMRNITKKFPGVIALDNVSFEAYTGEILALCGENGAGKSTLMKILSGSYPHSSYSGEIYINGQKCVFSNAAQSEKTGIAMIYQEISMHLDVSVAENLFLGRWFKKGGLIDWASMNNEAMKYLEMVGLDISPSEELRNLSASQQQLISIARALSKNPCILVLDEPTSPLTLNESDNLFRILHKLKEQGMCIILISHKLDEVFDNADCITVLRDGKTISSNNIVDVDRNRVVMDMVGREITSYYPKEIVDIGDVAFEVKNLSVPHPYTANKLIVEDISFQVRKGEILGIAGLVGAGRSESVNALFGKTKKAAGEVFIDGLRVNINKPADAISNGIALLTEDRKADGTVAMLSIKENTTLASLKAVSKSGMLSSKQEREHTKEYFEKVKIKAPSINTLVQQLSGGNQQKVVLAKWLMRRPKVLILDEPTRGVDVGAKYEIYKIMMELVKQGIAIIMISSELPELLSMSDRVIVLAGGGVQGEMEASECTQEIIMQYATLST